MDIESENWRWMEEEALGINDEDFLDWLRDEFGHPPIIYIPKLSEMSELLLNYLKNLHWEFYLEQRREENKKLRSNERELERIKYES